MYLKTILASAALPVCAVALALPTGAAASNPTKVKVRVEGRTKTLLPMTTVTLRSGLVKKGGHSCPANSGAGALNQATHGAWSATWFSGLGFDVTKIFGETDNFTTTHSWWELFKNNVATSTGICDLTPRRGDQLLFAAVPANGTAYPLGLKVLSTPAVGHAFKVKVVSYGPQGQAKALAGATVSVSQITAEPVANGRISAKTNASGVAQLTETRLGLIDIGASKRGYIRAATVAENVK
jgi:hypothetical protein